MQLTIIRTTHNTRNTYANVMRTLAGASTRVRSPRPDLTRVYKEPHSLTVPLLIHLLPEDGQLH